MDKRLFAILFLIFLNGVAVNAQNQVNDDLLRESVRRKGQAVVTMPVPRAEALDILSRNISIGSIRDGKVEIILSPLTVEWFISGRYSYKILEEDDSKGVLTAANVSQAMEWNTYPTYLQYDSIMRSFANLYPQICRLDTIGTTNYGKLVMVLKISDNPLTGEAEPEVFYTSSMHGDETGGFVLMLRLTDFLLKNYSSDSRAKNLVDNLEIWINPLANPDGTYRTGNTISSPTRYNANGYDLNRNFPDPVDDDPLKQKETLDMMKFMQKRNFIISANFHSGEEVVNYPWDRWERRHPDEEWFYHISRKYADTVHLHSVAGYMTFMENGVTNGWDWYYIYGGRQDYVTWELHGREVTIELDDTKLTPAANLNALWEYNWRSLLGYLENALNGIHGRVTSSDTGEAVPARIEISGHDADNSHVYSDTLTGRFTRLIAPGTWDLDFTAEGYLSKSVRVTVAQEEMTWLDVEMVPFINPIDTVSMPGLFIYPNPAGDHITIVLPDRQLGTVAIGIFNSMGIRMKRVDDMIVHTVENSPLRLYVGDLQPGVYTVVMTNKAARLTDKARFVIVKRK